MNPPFHQQLETPGGLPPLVGTGLAKEFCALSAATHLAKVDDEWAVARRS